MSKIRPITGLGPVRVTADYNRVRFLVSLLFAAALILGIMWAQYEGYIALVNRLQTIVFTIVFAIVLVVGVSRGLYESWHYSNAIDAIKRVNLDTEELKRLLDVHDLSERSVDLLQNEIEDEAFRRVEKIEYFAFIAVQVGLFGTVLGMMLGILEIADKVRSIESMVSNLPTIIGYIAVAPATTLVGIVVSLAVLQVARMARDSAMAFTHRVARTLHDHLARKE
ncbi:MAG: MotA/TolQ/ExbB proton channel family protein [Patescibacteria group bacterium]